MIIEKLWLNDFRNYVSHEVTFSSGLTALVGANGVGKTNLVEALSYLSTLKSFRSSPTESLVRKGCSSAFVRAEGVRDDRSVLIEVEISKGRSRAQVNKQKLKRTRDLLGALQVTVFSPDDLALIKEGPSLRRNFLDNLCIAIDPSSDVLFQNLEKSLKQRNALLKQIRAGKTSDALSTLDVWDKRLSEFGESIANLRTDLLKQLLPFVNSGYDSLAGSSHDVGIDYQLSWSGMLIDALIDSRENDIRRAVTTIGPHRDDVVITLDSLSARNEASQGEQRTLALALRLASHNLIKARLGEPPLLLLDDVLSELDEERSIALLQNLPDGQTVITSAVELPPQVVPDLLIRV